MLHRRALIAAAPALALAGRASAAPDLSASLAAIERASGGKLGVCVTDSGSGAVAGWRMDARFPFCSSFKALLAARALSKVERGELHLGQLVRYGEADLAGYAPITRKHVEEGMTLRALCEAAVEVSDNGAANALLRLTGGPAALTAWMRANGDPAFQLSHNETGLNRSRYGEPHDTTTPRAMAQSYLKLATGPILEPASRALLVDWLVANTTGGKRLRAGLPAGWRVGDKTGTWNEGWFSTVDIALAWPPARQSSGRRPLAIAGFVTDQPSTEAGEAALAAVAHAVARWSAARG